jgi:hypothetical protein
MNKQEIKKATNRELLVEYIKAYSSYDTNFVLRRGTKQLMKHLKDLESELVARAILTEQDIEELNR